MKSLCIAILGLLILPNAWAECNKMDASGNWMNTDYCGEPVELARLSPAMMGSVPAAGVVTDYCLTDATCSDTYPEYCEVYCIDFEGSAACYTGYDSVCYTGVLGGDFDALAVGGTGAIDFTVTHNGTLSCNDKGSNAVQITVDGGQTSYCSQWLGAGTFDDDHYGQLYFNIVSHSLGTGGEYNAIVGFGDGSNVMGFIIKVTNVSGDLKLYALCDGCTSTAGSTTISTGTWYRLRWQATHATDLFKVWVNDTLDINITDFTGVVQMRRFHLGDFFDNADNDMVIQMDNVALSSTALPNACN